MKATSVFIMLFVLVCTGCGRKSAGLSSVADSTGATIGDTLARDTLPKDTVDESIAEKVAEKAVIDDKDRQKQLEAAYRELNERYNKLDDPKLRLNMYMYGLGTYTIEVYFIHNTAEARKAFREKVMDSPFIRFNGPEEPIPDAQVCLSDTLGIALRPLRSVYHTEDVTADFVLINQSREEVMCGDSYWVTYEDEQGVWRKLPINTLFNSIGYLVLPGEHKNFTASLYPELHPNKPGRYRFFYPVSLTKKGHDFTLMTEFRLTADKQEAAQATRLVLPAHSKTIETGGDTVNIEYIPSEASAI